VRANQIAAELAPVIAELRAAGITSKKGIAKALNKRCRRLQASVRIAAAEGYRRT
jgi:hypothetical protein